MQSGIPAVHGEERNDRVADGYFDDQVELAVLERPSGALRVSLLKDGAVDIRTLIANEEGELFTTKKGVIVKSSELADLLKALQQAIEE